MTMPVGAPTTAVGPAVGDVLRSTTRSANCPVTPCTLTVWRTPVPLITVVFSAPRLISAAETAPLASTVATQGMSADDEVQAIRVDPSRIASQKVRSAQ